MTRSPCSLARLALFRRPAWSLGSARSIWTSPSSLSRCTYVTFPVTVKHAVRHLSRYGWYTFLRGSPPRQRGSALIAGEATNEPPRTSDGAGQLLFVVDGAAATASSGVALPPQLVATRHPTAMRPVSPIEHGAHFIRLSPDTRPSYVTASALFTVQPGRLPVSSPSLHPPARAVLSRAVAATWGAGWMALAAKGYRHAMARHRGSSCKPVRPLRERCEEPTGGYWLHTSLHGSKQISRKPLPLCARSATSSYTSITAAPNTRRRRLLKCRADT
jgi:hypothetical protein